MHAYYSISFFVTEELLKGVSLFFLNLKIVYEIESLLSQFGYTRSKLAQRNVTFFSQKVEAAFIESRLHG